MSFTTINRDLAKAIRTATSDELKTIIEIVRERQKSLQKEAARAFIIGDKVRFDAKTRGIIEGTITKVNLKTVKVKQTNGLGLTWSVSPSLLKKVA
jgi:hypothetical protein